MPQNKAPIRITNILFVVFDNQSCRYLTQYHGFNAPHIHNARFFATYATADAARTAKLKQYPNLDLIVQRVSRRISYSFLELTERSKKRGENDHLVVGNV